jgi:two-component system, NtrC family, response regulator AtoC
MARTVLIIDDETNMRWVLSRALQKAGYDTFVAEQGEQGLLLFAQHSIDLVLLDLKMPGMDGLAVLRELRQRSSDIPILLLTAYATVPTAVEALQIGATDYLRKPFDIESLLGHIGRHLAAHAQQKAEMAPLPSKPNFVEFVGAAPILSLPLARAQAATCTDSTVIIQGETGTGRQHLARLIHANTPITALGRFVVINCASLPPSLLEHLLLGQDSHAVTELQWQEAFGGSLLLANIDAVASPLQEHIANRLYDYLHTAQRPHGLRLLLTTQQELAPAWLRVQAFALTVELPPLRARLTDLPLLLRHFAPKACWSREARAQIEAYAWPGNVAELQRVVQQVASLADDECIQLQHLPTHLLSVLADSTGLFYLPPEGIQLEKLEQDLLRQALSLAHGNKSSAARLLGLSRATLLYRLEKYGLE